MQLEFLGLGVIVFGPVLFLLWGLAWLLLGRRTKPTNRDLLIPRMTECRKALDLAGDPTEGLRTCHGEPVVRISLEDPDNSKLPNLVVSVHETTGGLNRQLPFTTDRVRPILLRRETTEDRIGKLLLVNRELQTGDTGFDDNVYIETTASFDVASEALSDPRVRDRVQRLLDDGWTHVVIHGKDLVRVEQIPTDETSVDPNRIRWAIDHLGTLAGVLVPVIADRPEPDSPSWRRKLLTGAFVVAWLAGGALVIAALRIWPPLVLKPFFVCATAAVIFFLLSVPMLALLVRGRSNSLHTLYGLMARQAVAVLPLCVGIPLVINGAFDEGERDEHVARVISVDRTSVSLQYSSYYARLESWLAGQDSVEVRISKAQYDKIGSSKQARLRISMGHGALGWPWCAGVQMEP